MVNTWAKGHRAEKFLRDFFTALGYLVVFKSVHLRFGCLDYANMFDIVAYKDQVRLYISVKHHKDLPQLGEISRHKLLYGKSGERYLQIVYHNSAWLGRGAEKFHHSGYWEIFEV